MSVAGTLAGGALTAAITFRSERRKDDALARQQELQLRSAEQQLGRQLQSEERRQIRELQIDHRRQVYQEFLSDIHGAQRLFETLFDVVREGDPSDEDIDNSIAETKDVVRAAWGSHHKVQLEGPDDVAFRAYHAVSWLHDLPRQLESLRAWVNEGSPDSPHRYTPPEAWRDCLSGFRTERNRFVDEAREALGELLTLR